MTSTQGRRSVRSSAKEGCDPNFYGIAKAYPLPPNISRKARRIDEVKDEWSKHGHAYPKDKKRHVSSGVMTNTKRPKGQKVQQTHYCCLIDAGGSRIHDPLTDVKAAFKWNGPF